MSFVKDLLKYSTIAVSGALICGALTAGGLMVCGQALDYYLDQQDIQNTRIYQFDFNELMMDVADRDGVHRVVLYDERAGFAGKIYRDSKGF